MGKAAARCPMMMAVKDNVLYCAICAMVAIAAAVGLIALWS